MPSRLAGVPPFPSQGCRFPLSAVFPSFDIVGFGAIAVDDLLHVDGYPPAESKVRVQRRERHCGGQTSTALVAAARLGARCAYAGLLGSDSLSQFVVSALRREGVELGYAVERPDAQPAHSTIIVDGRERTRTIFASIPGALGPDENRPDAGLIQAAKTVLVDHHGTEGTLRVCKIAREAGVPIVGDPERDSGGRLREVLALIDHLIVNDRFAKQLTGADATETATERLWDASRQAVVVTCGEAGCWYVDSSGAPARHVRAFAVNAIDTTGCGDVFHGVYAAMLARGIPLGVRVRIASAAAAMKARLPGGQDGCPTFDQLDAFLQSEDSEAAYSLRNCSTSSKMADT